MFPQADLYYAGKELAALPEEEYTHLIVTILKGLVEECGDNMV